MLSKAIRNLILFFALSGITHVIGQAKFRAGLTAGLAATQVHGDAIGGFNKLGISGGLLVDISGKGRLSGGFEMIYLQKGSRKPANPDAGDFTTWGYTFNYIDVPILLTYHLNDFYVQAGVYGGFLIGGEGLFDGSPYEITNPAMRRYDLGVAAGVGIDFTEHWAANVRYSNSVIPIRKAPDGASVTRFYDAGMLNIVAQAALIYRLGE